tara:strand:+ start:19660 stop:20721 length:1062 start_codon:yes stop_codon:yes gene_type:complete
MKKIALIAAAMFMLSSVGCMKPYDIPEFAEIETSETGYLIPLEGNTGDQKRFDSEAMLEQQKVAAKRVQITHKWVQTGRLPNSGEWMSTVRLVKVDRKPITREWTADQQTGTDQRNQAIWVESSDSVGFSVGFSCTAMIEEKDTSKFLYQYTSKDLAAVMDTEIRAKIQESAADKCAEYPLDDLRGKKKELIEYVRTETIPFFAERGITITAVGMFGGFTYENKQVQDAIDKTVQDQQLKVSALAEEEAKTISNRTRKLEAEAEAEAARLEAQGEAEGIKLVADAKAYEIEKATENLEFYLKLKELEVEMERLKRWDGKYPLYFMQMGRGSKDMPTIMIQPPKTSETTPETAE